MSSTMFTTPAQISALAARLAAAPAVALDTEFMRERTYRAQLCLLQLADARGPLCVDPLAGAPLTPLAAALAPPVGTATPVKIMHACRQDIEVLLPALGMVRPVFDTQIAAALCGMPAQIGYAELVRRQLGIQLPKGQTRTDWAQRPLSEAQVDYALDDVRYLAQLRESLMEQLDNLGRGAWLTEELAGLEDPGAYLVDPQQAWLRVRSLKGLDPDRARLAQAIAAWREQRASTRNQPRGWILDDAVMRDIVIRAPRAMEDLAAIPDIQQGFLKHSGERVLQLIQEAGLPVPLPPLPPRPPVDPAQMAVVKKLSAVLQAMAAELKLAPEVLATRRDLEQLADGRRDGAAVLTGWRRAVIGEALLAAL